MDTPPPPDQLGSLAHFWRVIRYGGPVYLIGWAAVAVIIIWAVIAVIRSACLRKRLPHDGFLPFSHIAYLLFLGCVGVNGQLNALNPDPIIYALIYGQHLVHVAIGSMAIVLSAALIMVLAKPPATLSPFALIGIAVVLISLMLQIGTILITIAHMP